MNQVKSTISPGYRWRLVLITVIMLGFGVLCVYDWQVRWPLKVEMYDTYIQIEKDNPEDYPTVWKAYAEEKGWDSAPPKRKTSVDVRTQLIMALITLPLGFFFLFKLVKENGRWVAMDEQGITASGGHVATWESIKSLDETRWKSKGIAYLHYTGDGSKERKILLDDFKQEREATKQIVAAVQELLNPSPEEAADAAPVSESESDSGNESTPTTSAAAE